MTSDVDFGRSIQLLQSDLLDIVMLPHRMVQHSMHWTSYGAKSTTPTKEEEENVQHADHRSTGSTSIVAMDSVVDGLVTGAHLRQLVKDTLVRVRIPKKRRNELLLDNPYIKMLVHNAEMEQQRQLESRAASSSEQDRSSPPPPQRASSMLDNERFAHRIGRVIGIFLKSEVENPHLNARIERGGGGEAPLGSAAPPKREGAVMALVEASPFTCSPASWLVAVNLGERTATFGLQHISDELYKEEEHRVWTRSTIRKFREDLTASPQQYSPLSSAPSTHSSRFAGGVSSAGHAASIASASVPIERVFLEGEAGVELRQRLRMLRGVLTLMREATAAAEGSHRAVRVAVSTLPPPRLCQATEEEDEDEGKGDEAELVNHHPTTNHRKTGRPRSEVEQLTGPAAKERRIEQLMQSQEQQLQQLRHLLTSKQAEIKSLFQRQQERDKQHSQAVQTYTEKLREADAQRQKLLSEKEKMAKTLKLTAEMASRYQAVYMEVTKRLLPASTALLAGGPPLSAQQQRGQWEKEDLIQVLTRAEQLVPKP